MDSGHDGGANKGNVGGNVEGSNVQGVKPGGGNIDPPRTVEAQHDRPAERRTDTNRFATSEDHQLYYGPRVPQRPARDLASPLGNAEVRLMNLADLAALDETRSMEGTVVLAATPLVETNPEGSLLESRPYHGLALSAWRRRRNTMVVGATGSGKTYRYAIPLIHAILRDTDESILYNNLKGPRGTEEIRELVARVAPGTPVIVFAPGNAARSVGINFLKFARRHRFESTIVSHLLAAIEKGRDGSSYWEMSAKPVLEALVRMPEIESIAALHELLSNTVLFESFAQRVGDPVIDSFNHYKSSGQNGATSSVDIAGRVAPLCATESARAVASGADELDLLECIASPKRFVLVIECSESTYRTEAHLVSLFLSLWFEALLKVSESNNSVLPRGVNMIIDEFGITPPIPDLARTLNVGRDRGYAFWGLVQTLGQVRATYKDDAELICAGCCSSIWFCSGISVTDRETASRLPGSIVVKTWSTTMRESAVDGKWEAESRTSRSESRPLLLPEDCMISEHPEFGGYAVANIVDSKFAYVHFTGAWECSDIADALQAAAKRSPMPRSSPLPAVPQRGLVKLGPWRPPIYAADASLRPSALTVPQMRHRIEALRMLAEWTSSTPIPNPRHGPARPQPIWIDRWIEDTSSDPLRVLEVLEAMASRQMRRHDLLKAAVASKAETPETAIAWWDFNESVKRDRRRRFPLEPDAGGDGAPRSRWPSASSLASLLASSTPPSKTPPAARPDIRPGSSAEGTSDVRDDLD